MLLDFAEITNSGYFAIFDGHAGKKAAKIASTTLTTMLEKPFREGAHSPERISSEISAIFVSFNDKLCTSLVGDNSGCTALVAIFCPDTENRNMGHLYVANIGDSLGILSSAHHSYNLLSKPHNCSTEVLIDLSKGRLCI